MVAHSRMIRLKIRAGLVWEQFLNFFIHVSKWKDASGRQSSITTSGVIADGLRQLDHVGFQIWDDR